MINVLRIGDIVARPKALGFVQHLGVVTGSDRIFENTPDKGEHLSTLQEFAAGQSVTVHPTAVVPAHVKARVRRALTNYQPFRLFGRNCEDSVYEVVEGKARSPQLRWWLAIGAVLFLILLWTRSR